MCCRGSTRSATTRPLAQQPAGEGALDGADGDGDPCDEQSKSTTAATVKTVAPLLTASPDVPVTRVPTGKVNDHQERVTGSPARRVRIVMAQAMAAHMAANPQTGRP